MTGAIVYTKDNKVKAELNVRTCIIKLPGGIVSIFKLPTAAKHYMSGKYSTIFKLSFNDEHFILQTKKKNSLTPSFSSLSIHFPVPVSLELSLV